MILSHDQLESTKGSFNLFWKKVNKSALVSVKCWADRQGHEEYLDKIRADKRYRDPFHRKVDPAVNLDYQLNTLKYRYFAGETVPVLSTHIGPGISAAFLGSLVNLDKPDTSTWFVENIEDWNNYQVEFTRKNIWWQLQNDLTREAFGLAAAEGCLAELPLDIYNGIDTLMLLRGSENLAMDLVLVPDKIKEQCHRIMGFWDTWIDEYFDIADPYAMGNATAWLNLWGPGHTFTIQSDYMSLISTGMYEEFILPDIRHMISRLDHSMYHFDGPDDIVRFLPFLLKLEELDGIQWNPQVNCENVRHLPVLKKIQEAGKCLVLNIGSHEIEPLLRELSPAGLLLNVDPFDEPYDSVDEADKIVNRVKSFTS